MRALNNRRRDPCVSMDMSRRVLIVVSVLLLCAAPGSVVVLGVVQGFTNMVIMDFTSQLKMEGAITEERWTKLIDDMGAAVGQVFDYGLVIPLAFGLFGTVVVVLAFSMPKPKNTSACESATLRA